MDPDLTRVSKLLSWVLRHRPDAIGIELDRNGWIDIDQLLTRLRSGGHDVTEELLMQVVEENDKSRFQVEGRLIRAAQGHSVKVDLDLPEATPPDSLWHGTVERFLPAIRASGLLPRRRHAVHLSPDPETAAIVGGRRGVPVILRIDAKAMLADGHQFSVSANGVWLTDAVPPQYIAVEEGTT